MVVRRQIFSYYKQCVQRHLYARSLPHNKFLTKTTLVDDPCQQNTYPRKLIFISKNPAFTMRLDMLYDTFPDCRVVCLLRDPCQSIPSMISYIAHVWETFASPITQVR